MHLKTSDSNPRELAVAAYKLRFGSAPELLVRAPGRVNLIGEHTDYNGGFVFPAAIDREMVIAVGLRTDGRVAALSLEYNEEDDFDLLSFAKIPAPDKQWANYLRAVLHVLQKRDYKLSGFNAVLAGNVPQGAGLSSSAAYEVAVATVCNTIDNLAIDRKQIALIAQQSENEFIGVQCGIMDQFISALGEADTALLIDCRSLESRAVPLNLSEKNYCIVITHSGVSRGLVDSEYNARRLQCGSGVTALSELCGRKLNTLRDIDLEEFNRYKNELDPLIARRCQHVVSENYRTLQAVEALEGGDLVHFGQLMNESHRSLQHDFEVSCPEIDVLVELSQKQPGVIGSRITGGGFGGCTVSLVARDAVAAYEAEVIPEYEKRTGCKTDVYVCISSAGASATTLIAAD
jgi:galactokinase